jgi:HEAT repeat protein
MLRFLPALTAAVLVLALADDASAQAFLKKNAKEWAAQLQNEKPAARRSAAFALGKLGQYAAVGLPDLQALYPKEQDASVREAIVTAIGSILSATGAVDPQIEKLLIEALQRDSDKLVRRSAAWSLGSLSAKSERMRTALGQALTDPEQVVRQNSAWALGQLDSAAAPMLVSALAERSSDSLVKRDAANALFQVAKTNPKLIRPALNDLLAMCGDANSEVKKAALTALAPIIDKNDRQAVKILREVLDDADAEVRRAAALALSNAGGDAAAKAVPILVDALRHGEPHLKRSAALAMRNIGPAAAAAVPELMQALQDPDPAMQRSAAIALGGIGKGAAGAVPSLAQMLGDANLPVEVRVQAAQALTWIGNVPEVRKHIPRVLGVLGDSRESGDLRVRLAWLFNDFIKDTQIMDSAKPVMTKVCAESGTKDNGSVRYHCAYLLGAKFGQKTPESALNVLAEWLHDSTGRIYLGQSVNVEVSSAETKGKDTVQEKIERDSRIMAVEVLGAVGSQRVSQRRDIIMQLTHLARDTQTEAPLRQEIRKLLNALGE